MTSQFITHPIHQRLPQVRLKRLFTPGVEVPQMCKRPEQDVLDKIVSVSNIPCPAWQPAMRPSPKWTFIPLEERFDRALIAGLSLSQQVER